MHTRSAVPPPHPTATRPAPYNQGMGRCGCNIGYFGLTLSNVEAIILFPSGAQARCYAAENKETGATVYSHCTGTGVGVVIADLHCAWLYDCAI